jgi:hypothetical protein
MKQAIAVIQGGDSNMFITEESEMPARKQWSKPAYLAESEDVEDDEEIPLESEVDDTQSRFTIKSKSISRKPAKVAETRNTTSRCGGRP